MTPPDVVDAWVALSEQFGAKDKTAKDLSTKLRTRLRPSPSDAVPDTEESREQIVAGLAALKAPEGSDIDRPRKRLLEYFQSVTPAARLIETTRDRARTIADVTFVIATLPDYANSYTVGVLTTCWRHCQAAAGAAGYHLDRFYSAWVVRRKRGEQTPRVRQANDGQPGALLFTRVRTDDEQAREQWPIDAVVVLLVGETATAGLDKEALVAALRLAYLWSPSEPLRIVGPAFSGSAMPMRQALQDFAKSLVWKISDAAAFKVPVEIITPAATNTRNKPLLNGLNGGTFPLRVSFDSTVHTDPELLKPLEQRLLDMKLAINRDVAVLIEENTAWGTGLRCDRLCQWIIR